MVLWFAGSSLVAMWVTFRDPAIDHRLVVLGAMLPDIVDGVTGGVWFLHTLLFPIVGLGVVMGVTVGRRQLRRRLLAVPIGAFFHLIFDFVWTDRSTFWWPVDGWSFHGVALPIAERGLVLNLFLEVAGALALWWVYREFGLADRRRRVEFVRTGRIDRALTDPDREPPTC